MSTLDLCIKAGCDGCMVKGCKHHPPLIPQQPKDNTLTKVPVDTSPSRV